MKTFFKILLVVVLIAAIGGICALFYYTHKNNGGKEETVELLTKMSESANENLDGFSCEIDYTYSYEKEENGETSKSVKKKKIFVAYDGNYKKVAVLNLDEHSKFESMDYYEYELKGSNQIYRRKKEGFVAGFEFSGDASQIGTDTYEEECEFHPEFQIESILTEVSEEKIGYFENGEKGADTRYDVNLSTNLFTKIKTIEIVGEIQGSAGSASIDADYKAIVKIKNDLLTSYSNEHNITQNNDGNDMTGTEEVSISYKYSGGTFNPDKIYNDYAK